MTTTDASEATPDRTRLQDIVLLHVPIGVGIFGGLTRQMNRLDTLWRTTGTRS